MQFDHRVYRILVVALLLGWMAAAVIAYWDTVCAVGVAAGTTAGVTAWVLLIRRLQRLGSIAAQRVSAEMYASLFLRLSIYAVGFGLAYAVDRSTNRGLLAALLSLLVLRAVVLIAGVFILQPRKTS